MWIPNQSSKHQRTSGISNISELQRTSADVRRGAVVNARCWAWVLNYYLDYVEATQVCDRVWPYDTVATARGPSLLQPSDRLLLAKQLLDRAIFLDVLSESGVLPCFFALCERGVLPSRCRVDGVFVESRRARDRARRHTPSTQARRLAPPLRLRRAALC